MYNLLIFGINDFAEMVYENIKLGNARQEYKVVGFMLDDDYCDKDYCYGEKLYSLSQAEEHFDKKEIQVLLCLGYRHMNKTRRTIFQRLQKMGWSIASYYDKRAIIQTDNMGLGNIVMEEANIGVCCKCGDCNVFYPKCLLSHHATVGSFNFFSVSSSIAGHVQIGDCCFFGNNSSTRDKIYIANETLLGGGAYLNKDVNESRSVFAAPKCIFVNEESENKAEYILDHVI